MVFGLFHLHRIWGLIDRNSYADFWIGVLESRGLFYINGHTGCTLHCRNGYIYAKPI